MTTFPKVAAVALTLSATGLYIVFRNGYDVLKFYQGIQNSLFTGFLTLGGFLLSSKTFILFQLKKELYDSPDYKKHFDDVQQAGKTASLYVPLKNLAEYLLHSVLFALLTSIAQLTVGLVKHVSAAIVCLSLAITCLCVVFRAWLAIRKTLRVWFAQLIDQKQPPENRRPG